MFARERARDLIREMGSRLGVALDMDDFGVCAMSYEDDGRLTLEVSDGDSSFVLHAPLDRAPVVDREAFLAKLLEINLYGIQTRGCTIGLEPGSDQVILSLRQPIDGLDIIRFESIISNFIDSCTTIGELLRHEPETQTPSSYEMDMLSI